MVSNILVSTFSSSKTDSRTVSTLGSFSFARASNSYSSSSVSVWSVGKFPVCKNFFRIQKAIFRVLRKIKCSLKETGT